MKKYITVSTSASSLNYLEEDHDTHVIFGSVTIIDQSSKKTVTDVEDICPMQLREILEAHPNARVEFRPPDSDTIYQQLHELLSKGYEKCFIVTTNWEGCEENFQTAIARLPASLRNIIHIYPSNTIGFGSGLLALKADEYLGQGLMPNEVNKELDHINAHHILLYTILGDEQFLPENTYTDKVKDASISGYYPLLKAANGRPTQKVAAFDDKRKLLEGIVREIKDFIGDYPYNGFVICPVNHKDSRWFSESIAQQLNNDHISVLPVTPAIASLFGIDFFAVRVYSLPECLKPSNKMPDLKDWAADR